MLIGSILFPLIIGLLAAILTNDAQMQFHFFNKPALSPPGWLFPIVWTILYILMGLASYLVLRSEAGNAEKFKAITCYAAQLIMNFIWPLIFFNVSRYLLAFLWLLVMLALIVMTTIYFFKADKRAGALLLPLGVWTTFAGYLNLGIYILSRTPAIMHK